MKLLGERNWYLPRRLSWLPKISHEGAPEPARAVDADEWAPTLVPRWPAPCRGIAATYLAEGGSPFACRHVAIGV
jgi:hypothetical protein